MKYIKDYLLIPTEKLEREFLVNAAKVRKQPFWHVHLDPFSCCCCSLSQTSMSSKIIGASSEFFSNLAVDAVTSVRTESPDGKVAYPIKAINILKSHGRSSTEVRQCCTLFRCVACLSAVLLLVSR